MSSLSNPVLTADDIAVLRDTLSLLDRLDSRWSEVEDISGQMPVTLALRNFVPRNSFVRMDHTGMSLLIVDCESLAWGNPLCDLAQSHLPSYGKDFCASPDIKAYFEVVSDHWPHIDFETIQQLGSYATVLRCITAMSWDATFLDKEWAAMPMAKMWSYHAILPHALQMAGWRI